MYRPFRLLFALVVVSHGDPTAFDEDYRPADDTTPVPTAVSTPAPRPVPAPDADVPSTPVPRPTTDPDVSRSGSVWKGLARCKKASSRCVWTVAIFYFSIGAAWCTCVCAYGCYEVCRIFRAQRKTIPYSDGAFVPGAIGDAAPANWVGNARAQNF